MKEHMLHGNVNRTDIILYYTTVSNILTWLKKVKFVKLKAGWMMYNWLISSLSLGATIVLYDGSPIIPTTDILWNLIDKLESVFKSIINKKN